MSRNRFVRFTLALLVCMAMFPLLAFAQEAAQAPAAPEVTVKGAIMMGAASLVGLALTALFSAGAVAIARRSSTDGRWALLQRIFSAAQTAAMHAEAELRPAIQIALADGTLTPDEARELKAKALEVFKLVAGEALEQAPKTLGIPAEAMPAFLSGMLEKAVKSLKPSASSTVINAAPVAIEPPSNIPPAVTQEIPAPAPTAPGAPS